MVGRKDLNTQVNLAVAKDPPISTNEDMINLLCHTANNIIPNPEEIFVSLEPETCYPMSLRFSKVQKE